MKTIITIAFILLSSVCYGQDNYGIKVDVVVYESKTKNPIGEIHIDITEDAAEIIHEMVSQIYEGGRTVTATNIVPERDRVRIDGVKRVKCKE